MCSMCQDDMLVPSAMLVVDSSETHSLVDEFWPKIHEFYPKYLSPEVIVFLN